MNYNKKKKLQDNLVNFHIDLDKALIPKDPIKYFGVKKSLYKDGAICQIECGKEQKEQYAKDIHYNAAIGYMKLFVYYDLKQKEAIEKAKGLEKIIESDEEILEKSNGVLMV